MMNAIKERVWLCALGALLFAVPPAAMALNMRITAINLLLSPPVAGVTSRDPGAYASHLVFQGDRAGIFFAMELDGPLEAPTISFETTAPITERAGGTRTAMQWPGASIALNAGFARFTTSGRYTLTVRVSGIDHNNVLRPRVETSETINIEVRPLASVAAATPVTCLSPTVRITSPTATSTVCVNQQTHINMQVATGPGHCAPHTLTTTIRKPDGTTQHLPPRTSAPWAEVFTANAGGTYGITAEIRDRDGRTAIANVDVNATPCPSRPQYFPQR